jgi:hypothetical protein
MRERLGRHRRFLTIGAGLVACAVLVACVPPPPPPPPGTFQGYGFDACAAPTATTMSAWLSTTSYRAIGIYIGGETRACSQNNLTPSWVSTVANSGWHLAPLYVGLQAPCVFQGGFSPDQLFSEDPATAAYQGQVDAILAARDSFALGLGPGTPIYLDLEAYNTNDGACAYAAMNYLNGWDQALAQGGYVSGVYMSADAGMNDLQSEVLNTGFTLPNAIWVAQWNGNASVFGLDYPADQFWALHQRVHQYGGGHTETHGGYSIDIDNDYADAPLAG